MERVEQSLADFVSQMTQHLQYPPNVHQTLSCFILTLLQSKNVFTVEQLLSVDDIGSLLQFQQDFYEESRNTGSNKAIVFGDEKDAAKYLKVKPW